MTSYFSPLRKTARWYHKAVFELLLNTAVINSWIIYKTLKKEKIAIKQFRKSIVLEMFGINEIVETQDQEKHVLVETGEKTSNNVYGSTQVLRNK